MWQVESYTIEIRNTPSCDVDDNIVVAKTLNASELESGHNSVDISGLCPSMQYWYCTKAVWVQTLRGHEVTRKIVREEGEFTTLSPYDETDEWDVVTGPCSGGEPIVPGKRGTVSFVLYNIPSVGGVPDMPESITFGDLTVSMSELAPMADLADDGTFTLYITYQFPAEAGIRKSTPITTEDTDFLIEKR